MNNKTIGIIVIVAILAGVAGFYGGMNYADTKKGQLTRGQNWNGNGGGGRMMGEQVGQGGAGMAGGSRRINGNLANGEIIKKDDKSITVQMNGNGGNSGGSKIVYFSDKTIIGKMATSTKDDLVVGAKVMANGNSGSDGSIVAESIQIRPENGGAFGRPDRPTDRPAEPVK